MAVNLSMLAGAGAQFFDNNGNVLSGGKIYTYSAGTTTPRATYTTSAGNVAHVNPIVLDAAGRVPSSGEIWLTDAVDYKFILKTGTDVTIATYDNVNGNGSGLLTALAALASSAGASMIGISDESGYYIGTTVEDALQELVASDDYGLVTGTVNTVWDYGSVDSGV